jgi:hypothetical protein
MVLHQPLVEVPSMPSNIVNSLTLAIQKIHFVVHDQTTFVTHEQVPFPTFVIDTKKTQL